MTRRRWQRRTHVETRVPKALLPALMRAWTASVSLPSREMKSPRCGNLSTTGMKRRSGRKIAWREVDAVEGGGVVVEVETLEWLRAEVE